MNNTEIRSGLGDHAVWMLDAVIRQARQAITENREKPEPRRADYNLPEVEMAGEILFRAFETYSANLKIALSRMPDQMDGRHSIPGHKYIDEYIIALEQVMKMPVQLRKSDWVLASV